MNGWINSDGEVFIIFPREKLADEMGISYRKAIDCFKELLAAGLIWEHRLGRGKANHIYMAAVQLSEESADNHDSAPFVSRSAESVGLNDEQDSGENDTGAGDESCASIKECGSCTSESADLTSLEVPFSHPNKKDFRDKDNSHTEEIVSQSEPSRSTGHTRPRGRDRPTDDEADMLTDILEGCEFDVLPDDEAGVFRNTITRLFYSDSFKVGGAVLPKPVIRSHLRYLDGLVLLDTREKLRRNLDKQVKNSTAYVMAALLNNIWECKSDLMVDPYLNTLGDS